MGALYTAFFVLVFSAMMAKADRIPFAFIFVFIFYVIEMKK